MEGFDMITTLIELFGEESVLNYMTHCWLSDYKMKEIAEDYAMDYDLPDDIFD